MVNTASLQEKKMPNSDNTYGTFNKRTQILSQIDDGSTALQNFADVDAAKSWFYTANALTVFDECCTELQWSVVDSQKLKYTMTFGTKGTPGIAEADDWAGQFNSRKTTLQNNDDWANNPYTTEEVNSHLF
jgi:hypothetical protein